MSRLSRDLRTLDELCERVIDRLEANEKRLEQRADEGRDATALELQHVTSAVVAVASVVSMPITYCEMNETRRRR